MDTAGLLLAVMVTAASVQDCHYERLPEHHEAMVRWSMIQITSRRLARMRV